MDSFNGYAYLIAQLRALAELDLPETDDEFTPERARKMFAQMQDILASAANTIEMQEVLQEEIIAACELYMDENPEKYIQPIKAAVSNAYGFDRSKLN
jgi:hypothetical protein